MKDAIFAALLVLCAASSAGQTPASTSPTTYKDPLGFSYSLPADWVPLDMQPSLPALRQQVESKATSAEERKGADCAQVPFLARLGDPPSVIEVVTLSYECSGQQMTDKDLPGVGLGMAEGVKKSFNIIDPVYATYTLGSHSLWIERATGTFIGQPDNKRDFETVCTLLKNGLVCWMAFVTDHAKMQVFEQGQVVLENDPPAALVPADAFVPKS